MTAGTFIGGWRFTELAWAGRNAVRARFRADGWTGKHYQCYVGRRLAAVTTKTTQRDLIVPVPAANHPSPLTLIVVDPKDRNTDNGDKICWSPWNQYCVSWQAPAVTTDLKVFDIALSTTAGSSYDAANVVGQVEYDSSKTTYKYLLPPFDGSGDWEVAIIPRDDARPKGNAGTAQVATIAAVVYPLDLALDADGDRFDVSVSNGTLTATFDYGS